MNERFSQIRVDYQPGFTATLETYPVTPSLPEFACAIEAICSWSLGELGQMAIDRIGYSNTDGGVGVTYPDDLDDYDREVDGILIPEGFLQVRSNWGGVGHLIAETAYLEILGQILVHNGLDTDAEAVFDLAHRLKLRAPNPGGDSDRSAG